MFKVGVMQGRLSPRPYPKIQAFPWDTWKDEFVFAKELGVYSIEWIFEQNRYQENPIWTRNGRRQIAECTRKTGVKTASVCADYFLENHLFDKTMSERKKLKDIMKELIKLASEVEARIILLPVLEEAEIKSAEDKEVLIEFLHDCDETLRSNNIRIGIESELEAELYRQLICEIGLDSVGVYYDAGNCAAKGYDMEQDLITLYDSLISVHIKDRKVNGPSVFLGRGDTNISGGIQLLLSRAYDGLVVLQTYFEDDPYHTINENLSNINETVAKYNGG